MGLQFLGQQIDCNHLKRTRAIYISKVHLKESAMDFESQCLCVFFLISIVMEIYIIFVVVLKTCIVRKTSLRVFKLSYISNIGNLIICCHSIYVKAQKCKNELLVLQIEACLK